MTNEQTSQLFKKNLNPRIARGNPLFTYTKPAESSDYFNAPKVVTKMLTYSRQEHTPTTDIKKKGVLPTVSAF